MYNNIEVITLDLGSKIKFFRENIGLTQKQLADIIGVTAVTITRYEQNKREPDINTLLKISSALNVGLLDIIQETSNNNSSDLEKFNKLIETTSIYEALEILFCENFYLNQRLSLVTSSEKEKEATLETMASYISNFLNYKQFNSAPWNGDNTNGKL